MVIVGDDCALPPRGITGRRGLAGTILVHKVASQFLFLGCILGKSCVHRGSNALAAGHLFLYCSYNCFCPLIRLSIAIFLRT